VHETRPATHTQALPGHLLVGILRLVNAYSVPRGSAPPLKRRGASFHPLKTPPPACNRKCGAAWPPAFPAREHQSERSAQNSQRHQCIALRYGRLPTRLVKHVHSQTASGAFAGGGDCARSPAHRYRIIRTRCLEGHRAGLRRGMGRNRRWGWHRPRRDRGCTSKTCPCGALGRQRR
jgi:hypothetical protein